MNRNLISLRHKRVKTKMLAKTRGAKSLERRALTQSLVSIQGHGDEKTKF
jgi:hypothetical protein